jgi:protein archease
MDTPEIPKFEIIEHTADVGVRINADGLEELFTIAAQALFHLIDPKVTDKQAKKDSKEITLTGQTDDDLLVAWLNELISLLFAENFLAQDFEVMIEDLGDDPVLTAAVKGIEFSPYDNPIDMEIKAATYHNLQIARTDDKFSFDIIFDV